MKFKMPVLGKYQVKNIIKKINYKISCIIKLLFLQRIYGNNHSSFLCTSARYCLSTEHKIKFENKKVNFMLVKQDNLLINKEIIVEVKKRSI